jgi:16S rRNA (guanine527-N7)-methyltransferase
MDILTKYFTKLDDNQTDKFKKLYNLYEDWNQKINLVSRKDFDNFYTHHVLHSLSIAKFIDFKKGTKIMDLGTGGGFPAIPLAIFFPDVQFLAVDSIAKKIMVVEDVIEKLELKNCSAKVARAETITDQFDFVITRAVAPLSDLLFWTKGKIHPIAFNNLNNGIIALKGGDLKEEIRECKRKVVLKPISDYFEEDFFETKSIAYVPFK